VSDVTGRIVQLLRLLLVTDRPGEATAALEAMRRTLQSADLDPHALADMVAAGLEAPKQIHRSEPDRRDDGDDQSNIWFAFHRRYRLSAKECRFVESIASRPGPLSARQRQWLSDIVDRLEAS
jgi:hypothetical protein